MIVSRMSAWSFPMTVDPALPSPISVTELFPFPFAHKSSGTGKGKGKRKGMERARPPSRMWERERDLCDAGHAVETTILQDV